MSRRVLLVSCRGGPPLDYALPRIAARGEVHVLALQSLPARTAELWQPYCAEVIPAGEQRLAGDALADLIVRHASAIEADAICTLSEFAVTAVAQAAGRLSLPGAGPDVVRSRDKRLMRAAWESSGVPSPRFRPADSEAEVRQAFRDLTPPLLLKSAWGAGSVGQLIIDREERIAPAWAQTRATVADADAAGVLALAEPGALGDFLVEEIIPGTTRSWWEDGSGYGDYLSVEGIVVDGVYHPICITSRLPTIPPFTELCNVAPCALPGQLQGVVESVARAAVDALGLGTCGTHTEIKLMDGGQLSVIESAARFGGAMIAAQIEHVFGYDVVGTLTDALLGDPVRLPERMLTDRDARGAACTLSLLATNAAGIPWAQDLIWDASAIDWSRLLTPGTRIEAVPGFTIPDGTLMPRYAPSSGIMALGGILYLRAADAATAVRDAHAVLNGLENALAEGLRARDGTRTTSSLEAMR